MKKSKKVAGRWQNEGQQKPTGALSSLDAPEDGRADADTVVPEVDIVEKSAEEPKIPVKRKRKRKRKSRHLEDVAAATDGGNATD